MSVQISTPCLPNTSICEGDYGCGPDTHIAAIARIMPIFHGKPWDASTAYGALEVVEQPDGVMYITKCPTPAGTPLENCTYWAVYNENWNVRLETVEKEIDQLQLEDKLSITLTPSAGDENFGTWVCEEGADWETIKNNPHNVVINGFALSGYPEVHERPQLDFEYVKPEEFGYELRFWLYTIHLYADGHWYRTGERLAAYDDIERIENEYKAADQTIVNNYTAADKVLEKKIDAIKPQITGFFIKAGNADEESFELISDYTFDDIKANPAISAVYIKDFITVTGESIDSPLLQVDFAGVLPQSNGDLEYLVCYGLNPNFAHGFAVFSKNRAQRYWSLTFNETIDQHTVNQAVRYQVFTSVSYYNYPVDFVLKVPGYGFLNNIRCDFPSLNTFNGVFLADVSAEGFTVFEASMTYATLTVTKTIWSFDGTSSSVEVPNCTLYYR